MPQDERLIELISGSLDDALTSDEEAELEAALAASAEARQLAAELRQDRQALRGLPKLVTPESLKQSTLVKVRAAEPPVSSRPWQRVLLLAASMALVVGIFNTFRFSKATATTLYLSPGRLTMRTDSLSQELHLSAGGGTSSHTMVSENVSGEFLRGKTARVHLLGDAGAVPGGKLAVRLHFDFDGDGQVDLHSPSRVIEVDGTVGYQNLVCAFPPMEGMKDLRNGTVHLEIACETGPPLKLRLDPQQARVELPFAGLKAQAS